MSSTWVNSTTPNHEVVNLNFHKDYISKIGLSIGNAINYAFCAGLILRDSTFFSKLVMVVVGGGTKNR